MSHPNHTWTHVSFSVNPGTGQSYHPYLAAEGVWRVSENHVRQPNGQRPQFEYLHDLVAFLKDFEA